MTPNVSVVRHYDAIIDEIDDPLNTKAVDPVYDTESLKTYMGKWDGKPFIEALQLAPDKSVLEIGVGTGRIAMRICGKCKSFTGIDISSKTVEHAKENLRIFQDIHLVCGDFLMHAFEESFDVIYSTLTFMHIKDKRAAIQKAANILNPGGLFILSIDKNQQTELDYGTRKLQVYPDIPEVIASFIAGAGLCIEKQFETEFAVIFVASRREYASQETDKERQARIYPIILSEYNPAWPAWYGEEKRNLPRLLGPETVVGIHHCGSTAVPGLLAKPTVDILLEIAPNTDVDALVAALPEEYIPLYPPDMPTPPPHLTILKGYTPTGFAERVYHIHVRYPGDADTLEKLRFRDALVAHPETAAAYAALKRELAGRFEHDRDGYTGAKGDFIRTVMARAKI